MNDLWLGVIMLVSIFKIEAKLLFTDQFFDSKYKIKLLQQLIVR